VIFIFSHYCKSYLFLETSYIKGTRTATIGFYYRSMSCFTELHSIFYSGSSKLIPIDILTYLTLLL